ncbi:hypothetical protein Glove_423g74 [Diversispora epigaea]|uniref:Uncharacterized protein n=1 Tax=Diversispora epigaea TaxID=1348612 RepID=A0A397GVW4_9GLOM|nr:hypothetical protein Glove_423g74 [Diversispora epigaea]
MKKIFPKFSDAITYAKSLTDKEDYGLQYVDHEGQYYDSRSKKSVYGRVAVDHVETYLRKPIESRKKMYIVYRYYDYRKENYLEVHCAFDNKKEALKFASKLSDGKDSEPIYVFHSGEFFDQRAKDGYYGRIAVDPVSVRTKSSKKKKS